MNQSSSPNPFSRFTFSGSRRWLLLAAIAGALFLLLVVIALLTYQFGRSRGYADALAFARA